MSEDHGGGGGGEFMLFGVRIVAADSIRKTVFLNNLPPQENCVSANGAVRSASSAATTTAINRQRKPGVAWTTEEHKLFLKGLDKLGKGNWRGISRNFVKTRTPTQVASHAQKHFLRMSKPNPRRRPSLFDITPHSVDQMGKENNLRDEYPEIASASLEANSEMQNMEFTISTKVDLNANTSMLSFDGHL